MKGLNIWITFPVSNLETANLRAIAVSGIKNKTKSDFFLFSVVNVSVGGQNPASFSSVCSWHY